MAKKAFLVEYSILTRVIVDVPDGIEETENWPSFEADKIHPVAKDKILDDVSNYITLDNLVEIESDEEVPYDPQTDETIRVYQLMTPYGWYKEEDEDTGVEKIACWTDKKEAERFGFDASPLNPYSVCEEEISLLWYEKFRLHF